LRSARAQVEPAGDLESSVGVTTKRFLFEHAHVHRYFPEGFLDAARFIPDTMKKLNILLSIFITSALVPLPAMAHEGEEHGEDAKATGEAVTVSGEVVDMVCYIDHGATGAKHADCAQTCIKMGLPVGIKANDGKTYLLIGEHKPINSDLAPLAAKTITVKGKLVSRDGFNMIENAEIVKK
jgi:hypothetical protein